MSPLTEPIPPSETLVTPQLVPSLSHSASVESLEGQMSPVTETIPTSETLVASPSVPSFPDLDRIFIQSPTHGDSPPREEAADNIYAGIFDEEAQKDDPSLLLSDDSSSLLTSVLPPDDARPINLSSSRVSAVAMDVFDPPAPSIDWLFSGDIEESSKDEISASEVVPSMIGAGLSNLGNTCFLNSILQCFTHTVLLVQGLRSSTHSTPCDGHTNGFCDICALRDQIDSSLVSSGRILSPLKLVDNMSLVFHNLVKDFSSTFTRHQQEDAHEFMQCVLDKLDRCFLDLKKNDMSFEDDNLVEKVFGGRLISKLQCCNCGRSSDTYEPLIDLSLEIENVDTLSSALESFTKVENIDATFRCDGCKEEVSMEKQLMLDKTPSVSALHFKRFKTDGVYVEKIDKHIDFPLELDLQPYTTSNENNVPLKYDLYAVVVHTGSSSTSGHYFCFVRSAPDTWHKLDDTKVTKVSGETVLSQEAYILFYAQQGTPWFSNIMESQMPCLNPSAMNTSPKSVLDIVDNVYKPDPISTASIVEGEAGESTKFSEQQIDYTCPEGPEFLEINDISDVSLDCGQFPAGSNQESVSLHGSNDIDALALPEDKAINDIAMLDGNSYTQNGALDKNNCCHEEVNVGENDGFHSLTPPSTPDAPDMSFHISRDHLKVENHESCKKSSNKLMGDSERQAAIKYVNKMPGSRRGAFLELVGLRSDASADKKRKKMDSSQCKKGKSLDDRKKSNHASVRPVAAGISQTCQYLPPNCIVSAWGEHRHSRLRGRTCQFALQRGSPWNDLPDQDFSSPGSTNKHLVVVMDGMIIYDRDSSIDADTDSVVGGASLLFLPWGHAMA
ncbi:Ubiquitin specific protease, conserved site [Sesbania bispinosa]|nr:Ubiquitin specific protease, conserved site [Sesbania bispinosa]